MLSTSYLDELNEAQREAVLYCDGPSLVIAGAGSGKTRVLTYKITHLLHQGYEPWRILALTFTNKAAYEMKARIARLVGEEQARHLWMGTFHGIFARILHTENQAIGFTSNFTIYDASDSKSLIRSIIREMGLDDKQYKVSHVAAQISAAKNRLLLPDAYMSDMSIQRADARNNMNALGQIYQRYWARCRQAGAMDFDDILLYTYYLFYHNTEIRNRYESLFRYVLVDEYQDTNYAQHAIVWQLTEHTQRVCVVGDDAQSIYSFRGANIDNILTFQQLYKDARLFKLEQNYRSTQNIVGAANSLISKNQRQIPKEVYSCREPGQKLHEYHYFSDLEEAAGVAKKIINLNHYDHTPWGEIAILYRTNAQSRSFEEAFRKQEIPYRIYGGTSFYQRKEIKDIIAYFRLAVNPNDEEALKRVINYPARGIGQTTLNRLTETAHNAGVSLWEVIKYPDKYELSITKAAISKLSAFIQLIESFMNLVVEVDAAVLGQHIIQQSGITKEISQGNDPEDIVRRENVEELMNSMKQFVDNRTEEGSGILITNYLQEISLVSDVDEMNYNKSTESGDVDNSVKMMTVHSAKGLEFRAVFVVGLEEELFPNQMCSGTTWGLEEERRLFYVAITRAKEMCFLSSAENRYRFGKSAFCHPSRFLSEIDPRYIELESSALKIKRGTNLVNNKNFSFGSSLQDNQNWNRLKPIHQVTSSVAGSQFQPVNITKATEHNDRQDSDNKNEGLHIGQRIEHSRFGIGTITALTGSGIDAKATVNFDHVGTKQLLLRFAKFDILD